MLGDDREKAVKTVARRAKEAIEAAQKEKRNQAKLAAATKNRMDLTRTYPLTTPPERPKPTEAATENKPFCGIGELVSVRARTTPGYNRPAGVGYVVKTSGAGAATIFEVEYTAPEGRTFRNISIGEITLRTRNQGRIRQKAEHFSPQHPKKKAKFATTPELRLVDDLKASKFAKRGWRRKEMRARLGLPPFVNLRMQMHSLEKQQMLAEARLLDSYFNQCKRTIKRRKNGKFKTLKHDKKDLVSRKRLIQHGWGKNNAYLCALRKEIRADALASGGTFCNELLAAPSKDKKNDRKSVISCLSEAEKHFTAKMLYALNECRVAAKSDLSAVSREDADRRKKDALNRYDNLSPGTKEMWEARRRAHLNKQPQIKWMIVEAWQRDATISWDKLAGKIDFWCSAGK